MKRVMARRGTGWNTQGRTLMTLTVCTWLGTFFLYCVLLWAVCDQPTESERNGCALALIIPAFAIAGGIFYDRFQYFPPRPMTQEFLSFVLIAGLVALGLLSLTSSIILLRSSAGWSLSAPRGLIGAIAFFLGLVSSVLGIVSFYLDHVSTPPRIEQRFLEALPRPRSRPALIPPSR